MAEFDDVDERIRSIIKQLAPDAPPPGIDAIRRRTARRQRVTWARTGIAAMLVAAVGTAAVLLTRVVGRTSVRTVAPPTATLPPASAGSAPFVAMAAYASEGNLHLLGADGSSRAVTHSGQVSDPQWSHDGAWLAYAWRPSPGCRR